MSGRGRGRGRVEGEGRGRDRRGNRGNQKNPNRNKSNRKPSKGSDQNQNQSQSQSQNRPNLNNHSNASSSAYQNWVDGSLLSGSSSSTVITENDETSVVDTAAAATAAVDGNKQSNTPPKQMNAQSSNSNHKHNSEPNHKQQQPKQKKKNRNNKSNQTKPSSTQEAEDDCDDIDQTTSTKKKNKNRSCSKSKKFPPHWDVAKCLDLYLSSSSSSSSSNPTLIRGKLRVLPGRDSCAFITCDRGRFERDVLIPTRVEQNRGLDGDTVFVQLVGFQNAETDQKHRDNNDEYDEHDGDLGMEDADDDLVQDLEGLDMCGTEGEKEGEEEDNQQVKTWQDDPVQTSLWDPLVSIPKPDSSTEPNTDDGEEPVQHTGQVVHVVPPKGFTAASELNPTNRSPARPRRTIVGTLNSVTRGENQIMYLLTPSNKSLPQFLCPPSFQPSEEQNGVYRAEYIYGSWKEQHNWPPCCDVRPLIPGNRSGSVVQNETSALLIENGVDHGEFTAPVLKDVQDAVASGLIVEDGYNNNAQHPSQELGWRPTPQMYKGRRDYRHQRIFTIDPTTAKDLDDALHIRELPDGRVELGVHIADVSHFVKPETAVDTEAIRRATTVYLVDRVIPMLPKPLCEIACSLNENVERLAFSCVWKMNQDGTLVKNGNRDEVWYGRSVIKSCARLDYSTAQNIIDRKVGNGESPKEMDEALWPSSRRPTGGHTVDQVAADVRLMHRVAMTRRKLRFQNGAIALNGIKLAFQLEDGGETPSLCAPYPIRDSNRLVEEYMLLANYLVAQRLITHAGGLALLRQHPPPISGGLNSVVKVAKEGMGFDIDASNSQSLQESLSKLGRECDDELVIQCVTEMLMTPMRPAEYIPAGAVDSAEWRHFALNIPYYTHFTSPIRRYADVVVHRLLQATIDGQDAVKQFEIDEQNIRAACDQCNEKRMAAKAAQERSDRVFLALYLKRHPLVSTLGVVLSVGEKTFMVFVQALGCSAKVFLDECRNLVDAEPFLTPGKDPERRVRLIRKGTNRANWSQVEIKVFAKLRVSVHCKENPPIDIKCKFQGPWLE